MLRVLQRRCLRRVIQRNRSGLKSGTTCLLHRNNTVVPERNLAAVPWARHINKDLEVTVNEDQTKAEIVVPGFGFGDLNRFGDVEPSKLATKGETGRLNLQQVSRAQTGRCLGELDRLFGHDSGRVWYSMTAEYETTPHLYDPSLYYHPIRYTSHLNQIGNSSLQLYECARSTMNDAPLFYVRMQSVSRDAETRKATPHPRWFTELFQNVQPLVEFTRFKPEVKPGRGVYSEVYVTSWSDADYYYHLNHAVYIRHCFNVVSNAFLSGKIPAFSSAFGDDMSNVRLGVMRVMYTGECHPGDELLFSLWQDAASSKKLHFYVTKQDSPVFLLQLECLQLQRSAVSPWKSLW